MEVATLESFVMSEARDRYPVLEVVVKSDLDNTTFKCDPEDYEKLCSKIGTVLTNPKVKVSYQIVGLTNKRASHKDLDPRVIYHVKDGESGKIYNLERPEEIFKLDLVGGYIPVLSKVEKPSNPEICYGETTVVEEDTNVSKYGCVDNFIDISIFGTKEKFCFTHRNISDNSIRIVWDEAAFVPLDGYTSKVLHKGLNYSEREAGQPSTTIIKGSKIEDEIVPICNVRYDEIRKDWVVNSMYPSEPEKTPGQLRLMLPIQIKGVVNEYIFVFDVIYKYFHPERLNLE